MSDNTRDNPNYIFSAGTQVVILRDLVGPNGRTQHPRGAVGVIVRSPRDLTHAYRVKFPDGVEESLRSRDLTTLAKFKAGDIDDSRVTLQRSDLFERVIFQCIIGSQAYGLADETSDVDRRGIFLPTADQHWSLYGVPDQLESDETQETYWELKKFVVLALKANPNVLECLYSPLVEHATPLAQELLGMRSVFLSRLVYQTYNGYVMSQFKKMQSDIRNHGSVKWKHAMHLIRLLISGIHVLREGLVSIQVDDAHKDKLLTIKRGEMPWEESETWRKQLHDEFDAALEQTTLPDRPDYEAANAFLVKARRAATEEKLP